LQGLRRDHAQKSPESRGVSRIDPGCGLEKARERPKLNEFEREKTPLRRNAAGRDLQPSERIPQKLIGFFDLNSLQLFDLA
jgi:hypothetical protein